VNKYANLKYWQDIKQVTDHTLQHCHSECHNPAELTCHKMYNKVFNMSAKRNLVQVLMWNVATLKRYTSFW